MLETAEDLDLRIRCIPTLHLLVIWCLVLFLLVECDVVDTREHRPLLFVSDELQLQNQ